MSPSCPKRTSGYVGSMAALQLRSMVTGRRIHGVGHIPVITARRRGPHQRLVYGGIADFQGHGLRHSQSTTYRMSAAQATALALPTQCGHRHARLHDSNAANAEVQLSNSWDSCRPRADVAIAELDAAKPPIDMSLLELQRRHHQVRDAVAPGRLELQLHLVSGVQLHPFVGKRRPGDVAAQLLHPLMVMRLDPHRGVLRGCRL